MLPEPLLRQVRRLSLRLKRRANDVLAGHYESAVRGAGLTFAEVRPYEPGDDVRHIDWNVTARTGSPYIKRFVEERERVVMLLVDVSGSQRFGSRESGVGNRSEGVAKRQIASESAALIAFAAAARHDRVGLVQFTDGVEQLLPPKKSERHAHRVVQQLFTFQPAGRGTDLVAPLRLLRRRRRAAVFIFSDFRAAGWERALNIAARRHDVVAMMVSDPAEYALPDVGRLRLTDAEVGGKWLVNTSDRRVRAAYAAMAAERQMETLRRIRTAGADVIELSTAGNHLDAVVRFFRKRSGVVRGAR